MAGQRNQNSVNFVATEDLQILPAPRKAGCMPTIFHIGSLAKECLTRGYTTAQLRHFDVSAETNGLAFSLMGEAKSKPHTNSLVGLLELRKRFDNIMLAQSWRTDNVLTSALTVFGQTRMGKTCSTLLATYSSDGEDMRGKLQLEYERVPYRAELIVPVRNEHKLMGYLISIPAPYWMLGYRTVYDTQKLCFDKHALCVGFNNGITEIGLKLENGSDLRGSWFRRVTASWSLAFKWDYYWSKPPKYAIGWQYQLNNSTSVRAKLSDNGRIALAYSTMLTDYLSITYNIGTNVQDPLCGEHKLGVSWGVNS